MNARVEQADGTFRDEERTPICGQDFCDTCGDCLACNGGDECYPGHAAGDHVWMIYR